MKRASLLLAALLLIFTGCAGRVKTKDVSVTDVCCPYEIRHDETGVQITLCDGEKSGILWDVAMVPEDVCAITAEDAQKEYTSRYRLTGMVEGAAQLTFTALQEDETACFVLTLTAQVDAQGKTVVSHCDHRQREAVSVEEEGLNYQWNVDVNGTLAFSFADTQDSWSVQGDGENVCTLLSKMSTPRGCRFSAQPKQAGETTVVLVGETTNRKIHVVIAADDQGKLEVKSVQEQ